MFNLINKAYADYGNMVEPGGFVDHHLLMMGGSSSMGWLGFGIGWLVMLSVWTLVILGIIALAKYIKK